MMTDMCLRIDGLPQATKGSMLLPFQGEPRDGRHNPGRRFALPWAMCRLPFQGAFAEVNNPNANPLSEFKNAETLEANIVRQQIFDNLQPNLQPETDVQLQDIEERCKRLIISMDVYVLSTNELLHRYLSCNLSCNQLATMSRQAFAKSILKPAIDDGYVQMFYPDKPNHRGQKYKLTDKGLMILRKLLEGHGDKRVTGTGASDSHE